MRTYSDEMHTRTQCTGIYLPRSLCVSFRAHGAQFFARGLPRYLRKRDIKQKAKSSGQRVSTYELKGRVPLTTFFRAASHYRALCRDGCWYGVDIEHEGICDTLERGVWEPSSSKINSFASATEAACLVLSVDETVRNPQAQGEGGAPAGRMMGGPAGGMGLGRGAPMSAALGGAGMKGMMGKGRGVRMYQGRGGK